MTNLLLTNRPDNPSPLVTAETDHEYTTPRPISEIYEDVLIAITQSSDEAQQRKIVIDLKLTEEEAQAHRYVGIFTAKFDGWTCTVNWTPEFAGKIPPGHIYVRRGETEVAMLAPFTDGLFVEGVPPVNQWYGKFCFPWELRRDCAAVIARKTDKPHYWDGFGGPEMDDKIAGITE